MKRLDGQRFGAWLVLHEEGRAHGQVLWKCRCDCGAERLVPGGRLRRGESVSCGCTKAAACAAANVKHGASARGHMTAEYRAWQLMIDRCERVGNKSFKDYGGRGIRVAPEWREDFEAFLAHVGPRPSAKHTIDRKDNALGYQPGNVRWATRLEQASNKRNNVLIEHAGERLTQAEWARRLGVHPRSILYRLRRGWSPERALTTPFKRSA